jgi:hypothetical protein
MDGNVDVASIKEYQAKKPIAKRSDDAWFKMRHLLR